MQEKQSEPVAARNCAVDAVETQPNESRSIEPWMQFDPYQCHTIGRFDAQSGTVKPTGRIITSESV